MKIEKPFIFVLFGSTGDLAQKKIMPALCALFAATDTQALFSQSHIIAFSRRHWKDEDYHSFIRPHLQKKYSDTEIDSFLQRVTHIEGTFSDGTSYGILKAAIEKADPDHSSQRLYFLAIQPEFYATVAKNLTSIDLQNGKLIIEKPFGHDTASAEDLQQELSKTFSEENTYRIDHYLGKPGILEFFARRQSDPALEKKLNKNDVASITIKIDEDIDIQGRGEFYDSTGALRDVGQNHALEMLAIATADISGIQTSATIQETRAQAIATLNPVKSTDIVRGQYEGYTGEADVSPDSDTETYFRIVTTLSGERWQGISLVIEGGKSLSQKASSLTITFKDGAHHVVDANKSLRSDREAYEFLIEKALAGEKGFFVSLGEIMAEWKFITPILHQLKHVPLEIYKKGASLEERN